MPRARPAGVERAVISALLLLGVVGWIGPAYAVPMTYTESATASGSLGRVVFTDRLVTLAVFADTSNASAGGGAIVMNQGFPPMPPTTITVSGIGTVMLQSVIPGGTSGAPVSAIVFDDPLGFFGGPPVAGIAAVGITADGVATDADILDTVNSAFGAYQLKSEIGPITGPALLPAPDLLWPVSVADTLEDLQLTSVVGDATFTARLTAPTPVPEPASMMLLATGLLGLAVMNWRARRRR